MAFDTGRRYDPLQTFFFGGIILLLGAFLCKDILHSRWAALHWERASAMVTGSRIDCHHSRHGGESCNAYIDYSYSADAGRYYSAYDTEVLRNTFFGGRNTMAEKMDSLYPQGRVIGVYYNPKNPQQSDLGPDNAPSAFFAGLLLMAGLFILGKT